MEGLNHNNSIKQLHAGVILSYVLDVSETLGKSHCNSQKMLHSLPI